MPENLVPVRRALISVSDKTGLKEFATALVQEFKVELISTGGTAQHLRDAGLPVTDVSSVTGFPEMMDGRVKTLHPKIHGGLLALRDNPQHLAAMKQHDIRPIDLVCINLYPFAQTIAKPDCTFEQAIENIDIGGPSMIRSAAKNHRFVLVVTDPSAYEKVLGDLRKHGGSSCEKHRLKQAQTAFAHTAAYDAAIANYLAEPGRTRPDPTRDSLPSEINLHLKKHQHLRYGENPHQKAALYSGSAFPGLSNVEGSVQHSAFPTQLHGKELSYINLLDADAAMAAVRELDTPAACVVKHATPCGYATAKDLATAFEKAYAGDPLAAFGGIVALNRNVDLVTAKAIVAGEKFLEVIVAPSYDADALELLKARWKNVRLLQIACPQIAGSQRLPVDRNEVSSRLLQIHSIAGGYLVQESDTLGIDQSNWKVASKRPPSEKEWADLKIAWLACKYVKSNAIVIAKDQMMLGSGAGQQDRVSACRLAVAKAGDRAKGAVAASDAFFPFPDGPALLLQAGITAIIHPGGSVRDNETLKLIDENNAAMVLTGQRHFKH